MASSRSIPTNGRRSSSGWTTRTSARICAIAMLENQRRDLVVRREVNYINGGQRALDEAYGWGMRWTRGTEVGGAAARCATSAI